MQTLLFFPSWIKRFQIVFMLTNIYFSQIIKISVGEHRCGISRRWMITCLLHRRAFSSHASARHAGCRKVHRSRRTILRSILCRYVCYMLPYLLNLIIGYKLARMLKCMYSGHYYCMLCIYCIIHVRVIKVCRFYPYDIKKQFYLRGCRIGKRPVSPTFKLCSESFHELEHIRHNHGQCH